MSATKLQIAVVVEVPERTATTGVRRAHRASSFFHSFLESPVAQVTKHETGNSERVEGKLALLGKDATPRPDGIFRSSKSPLPSL
jgi:hypothetical protein